MSKSITWVNKNGKLKRWSILSHSNWISHTHEYIRVYLNKFLFIKINKANRANILMTTRKLRRLTSVDPSNSNTPFSFVGSSFFLLWSLLRCFLSHKHHPADIDSARSHPALYRMITMYTYTGNTPKKSSACLFRFVWYSRKTLDEHINPAINIWIIWYDLRASITFLFIFYFLNCESFIENKWRNNML